MTTKDILNQMEKEFESRFSTYRFLSKPTLSEMIVNDGTQIDERKPEEIVKSFIHSYTRTLLESFGEEMIKEGERVVDGGAYGDEYCENENCHFGLGYKVARDCTDMQRLKVKEIISSITN